MDEKLNLASLMLLDNGVCVIVWQKGMKMQNKPTPEEVRMRGLRQVLLLKKLLIFLVTTEFLADERKCR